MRLLKSHSLLSLVNSYMVDSPQPANISYMWNFGSLLATCLGIQIVTGIFLAMHYTPNVDLAFISVEHIMRDVNYGWLLRYLHANTASFFFIFVYMHIGRGLYYGSYKAPRVLPWSIGVIILVVMMATAFLGYILAQNSYIIEESSSLMSSVLPTAASPRLKTILEKHKLSPYGVWENLHLDGLKTKIPSAIKSIAGIYVIINLVNGKMYVGSAITGRMPLRFLKHLFYGQGNVPLWAAVQKYGLRNFAFTIIHICPKLVTQQDNKALLDIETHYITYLEPMYNIAKQGGNTFGVLHTEATKLGMRLNYLAERRATISKNSAKAQLFKVSKFDGNEFLTPEGVMSNSTTLQTLNTVAQFIGCNEKTVRRGLKVTGLVRGWIVESLGKANF